MRRLFLVFVLALSALSVHAQDKIPATRLRWTMNEKLLDLADAYETASRFASSSDIYAFSSLFADPSKSTVYCDYFSAEDFGRPVSLSEYINYSKGVKNCFVWVSNLRKGGFKYEDGRWLALLELDKRISYEDASGFTFRTSKESTGGDIHLGLECVWDDAEEQFRINRIIGPGKSRSPLYKGGFCLVESKGLPEETVYHNGAPLSFNDYGFALLPGDSVFSIDNDDYALSVNREKTGSRYDLVRFGLSPNNFRLRTRLSFMPARAYTVGHLDDNTGVRPGSFAAEAGADFGYMFPLSKTSRLGAYAGLGLSLSTLDLKARDIRYEIGTYSYSIDKATQGVTMLDLAVPLFISFEQKVSPRLEIVADLGAKYYLRLSDLPGAYKLSGSAVNGEEEPITFEGRVPNISAPVNSKRNTYSFFLMAGADYAIAPGKYAYLHIGWEQGRKSRYVADPLVEWYRPGVEDQELPVYPMSYDEALGGVVAAVSLLDGVYRSKRKGFVAELGVRFKFGGKTR